MNQQINLYQPMFRQEQKVFSAAAMLQLGIIAVLGLLGIYVYSYWQSQGVESDLGKLEADRNQLVQGLSELEAQFPEKRKSQVLEQQIANLQAELSARREIMQVLSGGEFGDINGFGDHLEALARRHVQGMWIRGVSIAAGGGHIGITGSALDPELVPVYIQRLSEEPVFSGASFNILDVRYVTFDAVERVDFVLQTSSERP